MKPETHASLRLPDGRILESDELTPEERAAYIEFALHLAAPVLAQALVEGTLDIRPRLPVRQEGHVEADRLYADPPPTMTVAEMARFLRMGRTAAYELYHSGQLPCVRVGRRLVVPRDRLVKWMNDGGTEGRAGSERSARASLKSLHPGAVSPGRARTDVRAASPRGLHTLA